MRSIIDEIARAEQQADEIRATAASSAREMISSAKAETEQALIQQESEEREKNRAALENAERDGAALAEELQKQIEAEADKLCSAAEKQVDSAIEYLLKKVQEIA